MPADHPGRVQTKTDRASTLSAFSTATLYEVAGRCGALPSMVRPVWPGAKLAGPAFTALQSPGCNVWLHRAIYEAPRGSVLVASTRDREHGYWGELMSRAALEQGLVGLVIDGGVRDIADLESLAFPVFATGVSVRGTDKEVSSLGGLNVPVSFGDTRVETGDLVVGDSDGVVVLQAGRVDQILTRARARERDEEETRRSLSTGCRLIDLILPPAS